MDFKLNLILIIAQLFMDSNKKDEQPKKDGQTKFGVDVGHMPNQSD